MNKKPKIGIISSCRNKDQILLEDKYIYNHSNTDKKGNKLYKCTYYKKENK